MLSQWTDNEINGHSRLACQPLLAAPMNSGMVPAHHSQISHLLLQAQSYGCWKGCFVGRMQIMMYLACKRIDEANAGMRRHLPPPGE